MEVAATFVTRGDGSRRSRGSSSSSSSSRGSTRYRGNCRLGNTGAKGKQRVSFGVNLLRIVSTTRDLRSGSKNTIIVGDEWVEVEFRINIFPPRSLKGLELGMEDTIDDSDVLGGIAEALAAPDELAIYVPDEGIERDGR